MLISRSIRVAADGNISFFHATVHGVAKSWTWLSDWTERPSEIPCYIYSIIYIYIYIYTHTGFLGGTSGKEPTCQPIQETWETQVRSLGWEGPLEEGAATLSSILVRKIPWTEEPGGLWCIGSQRFGHDWSNVACTTSSLSFPLLVDISCLGLL